MLHDRRAPRPIHLCKELALGTRATGGAITHPWAEWPHEGIRWTEDTLELDPRRLISITLQAAAERATGRQGYDA